MAILKIFFIFISFYCSQIALAAKYHGRFTAGSFIAKENFTTQTAGINSNDFNILSSRLYLHLSDLGSEKYIFVSDIRDKHDFFNKLDKEQLELTSKNQLQVRKFYIQKGGTRDKQRYKLGRFAVTQAGSIYLDGAQADIQLFDHINFALFAGLNPKKELESHLEFETKAINKGVSSVYFKRIKKKGSYYFLANAIIEQTYDGEVDRRFLFHNSIIQSDHYHRFTSLLYFDFAPSMKIQNLWLNYWHNMKNNFSYSLSANRVDVIEYIRRSGIRETLPGSIYDHVKIKVKHRKRRGLTTHYLLSHGHRQSDGLTKSVAQIGWNFNRFLKKKMNSYIQLGYRKNFTSNDIFTKLGVSYFSKDWEYSIDQQFILEDRSGVSRIPTITELICAHNYSREVFTSLSVQYARDGEVKIFSTFIKLSYRFGSTAIAPIRGFAPNQGNL
ncbi:MAG: hypothetical protein HN576_01780 [Bacteriovoracaceae bacterium]|jgi:hypothetical protein|nr:hypothetical protein [Bacteriovoracaceae bacterium]